MVDSRLYSLLKVAEFGNYTRAAEQLSLTQPAVSQHIRSLEEEFKIQKIPYEREKLLPVMYKGKKLKKEYYADFICYDNIVVELKSVSKLIAPHKSQILNYLNAADLEIGLLINFGEISLKWERITKFKNKELR